MPLHQIYPEDKDESTVTYVDIVAVHGLNPRNKPDHAFDTWTKDGHCWLKDNLPVDVPRARVFIHEYNAYTAHQDQKQRLIREAEQLLELIDSCREDEDEPPRPLIFMAHSLGGLLVKQCIILANSNTSFKPLFNSLKGILFFGVPHNGGNETLLLMGKIAKGAVDFARRHIAWSTKDETDFLEAITGGSPSSDTIKTLFRGLSAQCDIVSFYEGKPYGIHGTIVGYDSAILGFPRERVLRIEAHHSDVCRFDTRHDAKDGKQDRESYKVVKRRLKVLVEQAVNHYVDKPTVQVQASETQGDKKWVTVSYGKTPKTSTVASKPNPSLPVSIAYRIRKIDIKTAKSDVQEGLKTWLSDQSQQTYDSNSHTPATNRKRLVKLYLSLSIEVDQTAVALVECGPQPHKFPDRRSLVSDRLATDERRPLSKLRGTMFPEIDKHFHGFTPLRSPNLRDDKLAPPEPKARSIWQILTGLFQDNNPVHLTLDIRLDILILAPPGEHAYEVWKNGNGDVWPADFLTYEGFDRARISILGTWADGSADESLRSTLTHLRESSNVGPNHSTILVEFPNSSDSSMALAILRDLPQDLSRTLGAVVVVPASDEQQHFSSNCGSSKITLRRFPDKQFHFKFPDNGDSEYRSLVRDIWDLVHNLPGKGDKSPSTWHSWLSGGDPMQRLTKGLSQVKLESLLGEQIHESLKLAVNPKYNGPEGEERQRSLYAFVEDEAFKCWLNASEFCVQSLRIESSDRNIASNLCASLSGYGDRVFHVDARELNKPDRYGTGTGYSDGSAIIGPLFLKLFAFMLDAWMPNDSETTGHNAEKKEKAFENLVQQSILTSGLAPLSSKAWTESQLRQQVVEAVEVLGSRFITIITGVLGSFKPAEASQNPGLTIAIGGLDAFMKSPELGRIIFCFRLFQKKIRGFCVCRILFTHGIREDLRGMLAEMPSMNDDEYQDCLTSLRNLELQELKPIKDMDIYGLDWLWEDSEYKGWKAAEHSSILCVSGKPASGKSFLWRFTLDTFLKEGMLTKGHNVLAWFFFDENYPETRTRRAMLEKLLYDLLNNTRSFFPYFQPRLRRLVTEMQRDGEHDRGDVVWDEEDLEDVLSSIVQHPIPQTIYVLIDGLDEAKDPLECAESLTRCLFRDIETQVRVKLLVATRRGVDVDRCFVKAFKRHAKPVHRITQQDRNRGDILEYSKSFLNDSLARELGWSSEDAEECRQFLVNQSQGIFLWATLAKDLIKEYLEDIREASLRDFFDFLHGIPKDIGDLYRRIIQRLVDRFKDSKDGRDHLVKGKMMFQIAAQAKTSLSIHEFHDIYILPWPESRDLSLELKGLKDRRVPNLENIIPRYTGNLLEINQKKNTVEMLHPTLTEFLRNENIGDFNWPAVLYDEGSTIQTVALACLRYLEYVSLELTQNSWSPSEIGENELDGFNSFARIINNYPFLLYSLRHTASHFKSAQPGDVEKLVKVFIRMCESPIRFLLRDWILKQAESLPRLLLSLKGRVQHLTRQETRSFQNCVLHCAAHLGLSTAVRVALIAGADTRSLSTLHPSRETAICLAIIPFKERVDLPEIIVRILLENGADPNVAAHKFTPLHFAGKFMREAVVEILLKHNANVHARDSQDMTPLHRTIMGSSHASLAQETEDADHTPRTTPSGPRDVSLVCVQKLLEAGADIHAADSQGRKPIHWAAGLRDNVPLIEALLNSEKNKKRRKRAVNEKCNVEETVPLHWASGHGHQETVKYLLKNGARAGWADKRGKTALNWAARYGHDGILRNLLDALPGTDQEVKAVVDRQELGGRTALIWAAQKGHTCCVKLLVDNGADVNLAEDDEEIGGTPLSWAVTYGHIEIITLLFKHDVAVDGKRSILAWALASGRIEVFQILQTETIKRSEILNPDEPDLDGNTGFMLAAARGHVKVLEYLYKMNQDRTENINFHLQNNEDSTALHLAAGWGHIHAVRWLVETAELDVTHANVYGSTALHLAAYWGRHNVMKYLKSRQVNTTLVRDKKGLRYTDCLRDFENRQKE